MKGCFVHKKRTSEIRRLVTIEVKLALQIVVQTIRQVHSVK